ncbi:MAG: aminotransferase class V-fold PLP-dependent enzyme [Phycisphaerales bacterium]|nr:aminotransferase class V-fold PLP-dependent enzyme [Phycisphaerales bacterium]
MSPTYLDHAATSWPKPPCVIDAMQTFLAEEAANPGRGGHRMAVATERRVERLRERLAALIHAESPSRIALGLNCTDALNNAIHAVLRPFAHGMRHLDRTALGGHTSSCPPGVVTTVLEHNSVARPLRQYADEDLIRLTVVPCDPRGLVNPDDIIRACDATTVLVAMTHASNVLGTIQDVGAVGAALRRRNPETLLLVDAAQSVGHVPVDVQAMSIDLLAFPGHKALLGPTGTGALYIGPRAWDDAGGSGLIGYRQGGTGGDSTSATMPRQLPHQFEGGTPNTVGYAGWLAALDEVERAMQPESVARQHQLVGIILDHARATHGRVRALGPDDPTARAPVVSLVVEGFDPTDLGGILDTSFDIAARPGLHCAPGCHRAMDTFPAGTLRLSLGASTTEPDVAHALAALSEIIG